MTIFARLTSSSMSVGTSSRLDVVAVGVVRLEHPETILDRDAGRHDEETASEVLALGRRTALIGLPGDEHCHDRRLARPCGQLERQCASAPDSRRRSRWPGVRGSPCPLVAVGRNLGQPNGRLDRLDLTEERPDAAEFVVSPMLEEPRRFRSDLPVDWGSAGAAIHRPAAHFVDDRRRLVLLRLRWRSGRRRREAFLLIGGALALLRLRDRRDELGAAPGFDGPLRRLAAVVQLPVPGGTSYGELRIGRSKNVSIVVGSWIPVI